VVGANLIRFDASHRPGMTAVRLAS
jgi:hypothetical protein